MVLLDMVGEDCEVQLIPPPSQTTELYETMFLMITGEEEWQSIPPPHMAELRETVLSVIVGEEE